ncbi:amino acid transporter [Amanita muscaria]
MLPSSSPTLTGRQQSEDVPLSQEPEDDVLLARLGYKGEFQRAFSRMETIAFAFSIMGGCSSVTGTYFFPLIAGGHVGMVFGWLIPSVFVLCVAMSLAELVSSMPTSGGIYYFAAKLAPERYSALVSWITGWANVTGQIALLASIDYQSAQMLAVGIQVGSDGKLNPGPAWIYGMLVAVLLSHALVCSSATRVIARLTFFYAGIYVGMSLALSIALFVVAGPNRVSAGDAFLLFENNTGWTNNGWAFLLSFTSAMWDLTGFDVAVHISEEVANAAESTPVAIVQGVGATVILGLLLSIAMSFATRSVSDILASGSPLPAGQLYLEVFGKKGMLAVWSILFSIQWMNGVTQGIDASRVTFAFARDNGLPAARWLKKVNRYTQTPINAVWFVVLVSAIIGLLSFSSTALSSMAGATVAALYFSYAIPIFFRITTGRSKFKPGPFSLGRFAIAIGVVAVVWSLFVAILLMFPSTEKIRTVNDMNYTVVIVAAVFILSGLSWIISARKWFIGPVPNIRLSDARSESPSEKGEKGEKVAIT